MYLTVSGVAFICSHTSNSTLSGCMEVSNKNSFGFSNLSQERKKCCFPPLLSFLKKPQAEHVARAGSCLVFTLWMCFALWDRTHLKFHLFLWQISSFPASWRTFLITAQEAALEFLGQVSLWFLTAAQIVRLCMIWKSSLRENFPAERFCLWHRLRNVSF